MTVRSIRRTATGFALECGPVPEPELIEADAVIVAVPAAKAALLLRDVAPAAATELAGRQREHGDRRRSPSGTSSCRRQRAAGRRARRASAVKAVTLSSQKWPLETVG